MDGQLYLRIRGRVLGPYDQEKLQSLVRRGQLSRMHEVSTDGVNWVRAASYVELFASAVVKIAQEMQVAAGPERPAGDVFPFKGDSAVPPAPAGSPVGRHWYYEKEGVQQGPVDEAILRQMLATGRLDSDALVWNESMREWGVASLVPGLVSAPGTNRTGHAMKSADQGLGDLCKAAAASRPWAIFLAITAFVYAGLCILFGLLILVSGAGRGVPLLVAMGLFWMISGVVNAVGGTLLAAYSNRLGSLIYGASAQVLTSAMDRLKTFWIFVSIVLIVQLAFILFFTIWIFAVGVSLAHYV